MDNQPEPPQQPPMLPPATEWVECACSQEEEPGLLDDPAFGFGFAGIGFIAGGVGALHGVAWGVITFGIGLVVIALYCALTSPVDEED